MNIWLEEHNNFPRNLDVAIIGGGIAGVCVAHELTKTLMGRVALFEAKEVAYGASGRNDGQLLLGLGEHYNRIVSQFGELKAFHLWNFISKNNHRIKALVRSYIPEASLGERGGLRMAESPTEMEELKEAHALLESGGHKGSSVLLSKEELELIVKVKNFEGALYLPHEAVIQPVGLTKGIARLVSRSIQIFEHSPVEEIIRNDDGYLLKIRNGDKVEEVQATIVVNCASFLSPGLDSSGFIDKQIFPYRGQIIATNQLEQREYMDRLSSFDGYAMSSNFCYEYFRTFNRRFIIGGMRWSVPRQEELITDHDSTNHVVTDNLLDYISRHFPTLDGIDFPNCWTGIMTGTSDGLPLVGEIPGQSGAYVLTGFNGYGLSFAAEAARLIVQYIVDGKADDPAAPYFLPRRFQ